MLHGIWMTYSLTLFFMTPKSSVNHESLNQRSPSKEKTAFENCPFTTICFNTMVIFLLSHKQTTDSVVWLRTLLPFCHLVSWDSSPVQVAKIFLDEQIVTVQHYHHWNESLKGWLLCFGVSISLRILWEQAVIENYLCSGLDSNL